MTRLGAVLATSQPQLSIDGAEPRPRPTFADGLAFVGFTLTLLLLGVPWLHIDQRRIVGLAVPLLGLLAVAMAWRRKVRFRLDAALVWRAGSVLGCMVWATAALFVANAQHDAPSFMDDGPRRLIGFIALFVASVLAAEATVRRWAYRGLPWVALTVVAITWLSFWRLTVRGELSIVGGIADAVDQRDPQPIFAVFRLAFFRSGISIVETATASLRHLPVRAGLVASLLAMVGLAIAPLGRTRWLAWVGILAGAAVPFVTLSRTNVAVVLVVVIVAGGRAITLRWNRFVAPVLVGVALIVGALGVVGFRLIDSATISREQRFDRVVFAVEHLDDGFVSGLDQVVDGETVRSPHNTVLDLWLGGGVVAGLAGLALLALVSWWTLRAAVSTVRASTGRELQFQAATFGLLIVALSRILAGGGGLLDPVAWFGLGLAVVLVGVPERVADR